MSRDRIVTGTSYSAVPHGRDVELVVSREVTTFVEEVIPDGQLAGMMGHRPFEHVDEIRFVLFREQARTLYDQLGRALDGRSSG